MEEQDKKQYHLKRISEFLSKRGFFVVAGLCALCAGIAALAAFWPQEANILPTPAPTNLEEADASNDQRLSAVLTPTPAPATPVPAQASLAEPASATPAPAPSEKPVSATKGKSKAPAPVEGEIVFGYAIDTLLYSETLDLWTTHEGVDISAKLNTEVKSIRGGTVEDVYTDSNLGVCVRIAHENGLVSLYGNLAEEPPVKKNDKVNEGAVIGLIGNTAQSECLLPPHLHFALTKDGDSVNPYDHVLLGKE